MEYEFDRNEQDNLSIYCNPKELFSGFDKWSKNDDDFGVEIEFSYTDDQEQPSKAQLIAYEYLFENKKLIFENLLKTINKEKEIWAAVFSTYNEATKSGFPNCKEPQELQEYFTIDEIHIKDDEHNGCSYIGLLGWCNWDDEHGFGAIMYKDSVKDAGWRPTGRGSFDESKDNSDVIATFGLESLEQRKRRLKKLSESIHVEDASAYLELFQWLIDLQVVYGYRYTEPDLNHKEIVALLLEITSLSFTSKKISRLPDSFVLLKNLEGITLWNNNFTEVPSVLGKLPKLKSVSLSNNAISEIHPDFEFQCLLKSLDLSKNKLKNVDHLIQNQSELRSLSLIRNQIESIADVFEGLESLKDLRLNSNQLESLPESIGKLPKLRMLLVNDNKLSTLPDSIAQLSQLEYVHFESNEFHKFPKALGNLTSLKTINASGNKIDTLPPYILNLPELRELNISKNNFTTLPKELNEVKLPLSLRVWGNPFPIAEIKEIIEWINPKIRTDLHETLLDLQRKERDAKKAKEEAKVEKNKTVVRETEKTSTNYGRFIFVIVILTLLALAIVIMITSIK